MSEKKNLGALDKLANEHAELKEAVRHYSVARTLALSLRKLRENANLTQAQVAERMGITQGRVSQIESGLGDFLPTVDTILRYAEACGNDVLNISVSGEKVDVSITQASANQIVQEISETPIEVVVSVSDGPAVDRLVAEILDSTEKSHPTEIVREGKGKVRVRGDMAVGLMGFLAAARC